ncbi:hypothetical protein [Amorphus coralli]|uniref:hypothetical protein n=1 Tax=Amorphus coralli TaxID=340680 RepID=UPI0003752CD3|nr:hypothetical protein [Amorphus coralli]
MRTILWIVSLPLRIVGWLFFLLGAAAGAYDVYNSVQLDRNDSTSLGELWYALHPGSLNVSQAVIQRQISPTLWDPYIQTLLVWPAWAVLGVLGIALLALARVFWKPR